MMFETKTYPLCYSCEDLQKMIKEKIKNYETNFTSLNDYHLELSNRLRNLEAQLGLTQDAIVNTQRDNNFQFNPDDLKRFLFNHQLQINDQNHRNTQKQYQLEKYLSDLFFYLTQQFEINVKNEMTQNFTLLVKRMQQFLLPEISEELFRMVQLKQKQSKEPEASELYQQVVKKFQDIDMYQNFLTQQCDEVSEMYKIIQSKNNDDKKSNLMNKGQSEENLFQADFNLLKQTVQTQQDLLNSFVVKQDSFQKYIQENNFIIMQSNSQVNQQSTESVINNLILEQISKMKIEFQKIIEKQQSQLTECLTNQIEQHVTLIDEKQQKILLSMQQQIEDLIATIESKQEGLPAQINDLTQTLVPLSQIKKNKISQYYKAKHPDSARLKVVQDTLNNLYDLSCRKRSAQGDQQLFVKDKQSFQDLQRNYGIRSSEQKNKLSKICNSLRQSRGDGNCFYTSFGFQFFQLLLVQYNDSEFEQFLHEMDSKITFNLRHGQEYEIEKKELQDQLWQELKFRLCFLRNIKEPDLRIHEFTLHYASYEQNPEFKLIDGCFYALSTIFFRNLAYLVIEQSEMKNYVFDQQNLLIWEVECNSNEIVIAELAKFLKVHVKLIFFDNGSFELREYSSEMNHKIILLIQPGHYNSGYYEQK